MTVDERYFYSFPQKKKKEEMKILYVDMPEFYNISQNLMSMWLYSKWEIKFIILGSLHILCKFLESHGANRELHLTSTSTEVVTMVMYSAALPSGRKNPCL